MILPASYWLCVNVLLNGLLDLHDILHGGSRLADVINCAKFEILSQSGQGFWFCEGSNFWHLHRNEMSPLTQSLNCRSAPVMVKRLNVYIAFRVREHKCSIYKVKGYCNETSKSQDILAYLAHVLACGIIDDMGQRIKKNQSSAFVKRLRACIIAKGAVA